MNLTHYYIKYKSSKGKYYLVNTLRGTFEEINETIYGDLEKLENSQTDISPQSMDFLKDWKVITNDEDEKSFIKQAYTGFLNRPYKHGTFFFYLSYDCNLSCTYCNYKLITDPVKRTMSIESIDKAFDALYTLLESGVKHEEITLVLFGGEPFLIRNQRLILHFLHRYRALKMRYNIQYNLIVFSNGIELPYFIKSYKEEIEAISSVYITLSGNEETHNQSRIFLNNKGSYSKVIKGIDFTINSGVKTWLVFNAMQENIHQLHDVNNIIEEKGWNLKDNFLGCCVSRIKSRGDKSVETFTETALVESVISLVKTSSLNLRYFNFEDMRILKNIMLLLNNKSPQNIHTQNILQFNGCGNRIYQYSFTPEGEIYPCSPSIGNRELSIGRYIPQLSMEYPLSKAWTFKHEYFSSECNTCNMAFLCGGGCKYSIIKEGLNTEECDSIRRLFPAFIECIENNIDLVNNETVYEKV